MKTKGEGKSVGGSRSTPISEYWGGWLRPTSPNEVTPSLPSEAAPYTCICASSY